MITKDDLTKLYVEEEKTQEEIGALLGCDRKNIDYYLKKYGIPKRSRKEAAAKLRKINLTAEEIQKRLEGGMLLQDICEEFKVSRGAIYRITKEAGLDFKNHSAAALKQSAFMKENNPITDEAAKEKALTNSRKTRKRNYSSRINSFHAEEFKLYAKQARYIAYAHYEKGAGIPEGLVIDHRYSIKDGYLNRVPLAVISHPFNLRLVSVKENSEKSSRSIITLDDLYQGAGITKGGNRQ